VIAPVAIRRGLHAAHAVLTLVLAATGLMLAFPELRSAVTGGYGGLLVDLHLWGGVLFAVSPLLALAVARPHLVEELRRRLGPPDPWRWRKTHIVLSIALVAGLSVSGAAMWLDASLPTAAADLARFSHEVLTVVILVALPVHLVAARVALVQRVRRWLGLEPDVDELFDFDEADPEGASNAASAPPDGPPPRAHDS
jgi:cytochrome b subunit of formate dehydrogenase